MVLQLWWEYLERLMDFKFKKLSPSTAKSLANALGAGSVLPSDDVLACNASLKNTTVNNREESHHHTEPAPIKFTDKTPLGKDADGKDVYAGAAFDDTPPPKVEIGGSTKREDGFQCIQFPSPAHLISFYDKQISSGQVTLYPWQLEVATNLAQAKATAKHPYKYALAACNGSGKDAFVIAPFAVWFALCKIRSRCIITSASGVQLSSQTENYIRALANAVNEFHGFPVFKINQRFIKCLISGSEIRLFATDEEGKAEGYHPLEPDAEMAIVINEAKSVEPEIYRALRRCTGYNYFLEVSSPGGTSGDFYKHFCNWPNKMQVDYTLCAHHSDQERIEDALEGEHSAYYRSKWLAHFTSVDGQCVISSDVVDRVRALSKVKTIQHLHAEWPLRIGIDLAAGGDESSICATKGNKIKKRVSFRDKDTTVTTARLNLELEALLGTGKEAKKHEHIYGDDGGVGKAILDALSDMGWIINRVNNQSPAKDKKRFINRGAEMWYRVARMLDENVLLLDYEQDEIDPHAKFYSQLSNRFYKQQSTQGRIALEAKAEAKAHGRPSPDRADAYVLSYTGVSVSDFIDAEPSTEEVKKSSPKTFAEIQQWGDDQTYKEYDEQMGNATVPNSEKAHNSLSVVIQRGLKQSIGGFSNRRN